MAGSKVNHRNKEITLTVNSFCQVCPTFCHTPTVAVALGWTEAWNPQEKSPTGSKTRTVAKGVPRQFSRLRSISFISIEHTAVESTWDAPA